MLKANKIQIKDQQVTNTVQEQDDEYHSGYNTDSEQGEDFDHTEIQLNQCSVNENQ